MVCFTAAVLAVFASLASLAVKLVFMRIRRATLDDAEALCDLHIRSIRVLCAADYTPQQIEAWAGRKKPELYRQAMTDGGETMFVAVDEREHIIGFVAF